MNNIILIAIVMVIIGFVIKVIMLEKKISKAFIEKSWDTLPALIIKKYAFFGCIVAQKKYYQYYLKYLVESGTLLNRENDSILNICERKFSGNEDYYIFLVMRRLFFNIEAYSLISKMQGPQSLIDAFLSYKRKDYEGFINNVFLTKLSNNNVCALIALLAFKANQKVTIDKEIQSSPYYSFLKEFEK